MNANTPLALPFQALNAPKRAEISGSAMRGFTGLAVTLGLSEKEKMRVLGDIPRSTFHKWVQDAKQHKPLTLPLDVLLRISALLGIYKALRIIFADETHAVKWLLSSNTGLVFGGQRPLDLILSGTQDGMMLVRRYLDAWRGGLFASPLATDGEIPPFSKEDIVIL